MPSPRHLVALAATVLCGLAAAPAQAAVPGLNVSAYDDAPVALAKGAKQVRFFVPWKNFEPHGAAEFGASGPRTPPSSLTTGLKTQVDRVRAAGATPLMVVLDAPDWASPVAGGQAHKPPRNAQDYAAFVGELAAWLRSPDGPAPVYEVWNEPDAVEFWGAEPNADLYTALLRDSYAAIKAGDPRATVLSGATTGNNFSWIEGLYARGAKGSFDGVAVHTDTACSVVGPDSFYRDEAGRVGQYTFLGYREVRASMLANGDDKPIWMTEIGWTTTGGLCAFGVSAGKKPAGVSEADQAAFLTKAFQCMANDPYLVAATWFIVRDAPGHDYGLLRRDGSSKPASAAFAGAGAQGPGACGDFEPPALDVQAPAEGQQFVDKLDLRAAAADAGVGLARISYSFDGGKAIRNYTDALVNGSAVGLAPWQGSGALALGAHTVEVTALDANGNLIRKVVRVTKVAPGALEATLTPAFKRLRKPLSCRRGRGGTTCSLRGTLSRGAAGRPSVGGKVAVEWQWKNKQRRFRKLVGGLKPASKAFTFKAALKKKGTWRVRVVYRGAAPYKPARSGWTTFRVR